jgi:hypothetical protein
LPVGRMQNTTMWMAMQRLVRQALALAPRTWLSPAMSTELQ